MLAAFAQPAPPWCGPPRRSRCTPRCSAIDSGLQPPVRQGRLSHGSVLQQAASAVSASPGRLSTVDFPPERSESRSGTLVARYENNLNFAEKLLSAMDSGASEPIGGAVTIRDNVNPQGGGEYLDDDETLTGLRAGDLSVVLNAGVDAATLKQVKDLDDGGRVVLLNCGLDRVSWFAKRALRGALDGFEEAYYLKPVAGAGWLLKCAPHPWRVFFPGEKGWEVLLEADERPKMSDVESVVRVKAAQGW